MTSALLGPLVLELDSFIFHDAIVWDDLCAVM